MISEKAGHTFAGAAQDISENVVARTKSIHVTRSKTHARKEKARTFSVSSQKHSSKVSMI